MKKTAYGSFYGNNEHKIAYLAIRKCACTSIASCIASHKTKEVLRPMWPAEHARVNFDFVTQNEDELSDFFTFTFVRDPYARFLSFYRNWILSPPHRRILDQYRNYGLYENMAFDDCVRAFVKIPDYSLLDPHTAPMHRYVLRSNKLRVKFIGRLENLETDFSYVRAACSLRESFERLNCSQKPDAIDPFTPELRGLIYSFYRRDFELFGYDTKDAQTQATSSPMASD